MPVDNSQFAADNLVEAAQYWAVTQPSKIAYTFLVDGEQEAVDLSYEQLDRQARVLAGYLQKHVGLGQRAVLVYPTGLEFIVAFLGCLYAGVIAVPVPEPVSPRHLARLRNIVIDAQTHHILTTNAMLALINAQFGNNPEIDMLSWVATDTITPEWAEDWKFQPIKGESTAFLQYTSGSTGVPRGVIVSHRNLIANVRLVQKSGHLSAETRFVSWLPLFHDLGLIGVVLQTIYLGGSCVLMSPFSFLQKPIRWLQAIANFRGDVSGAPNFAYGLCARKARPEELLGLDLSHWRIAFNGAEPVRAGTQAAFSEVFKPFGFRKAAFLPCYGLAEATCSLAGGPIESAGRLLNIDAEAFGQRHVSPARRGDLQMTLVSCGRINWQSQEAKIVDPKTLRECVPGQVGELWVAGPQVACGYWNRPEETQQVFGAHLSGSGDGPYLRTGDLAFISEGELFVAGRLKDLIIIDGRNHYPQDIERTAEDAHSAIRPGCTCAFSIDDGDKELLVIIAELQPLDRLEDPIDLAHIGRAIRQNISQEHGAATADIVFIKPRTIRKTSSGKIQRHACRSDYLNGKLVSWSD